MESIPLWHDVLRRHIEPAIRMLISAVDTCSDQVWVQADGGAPIWQHVLHATYSLQKWMRTPEARFDPPTFAAESAVNLAAPAEPAMARETLRKYLQEVGEHCLRLLESAEDDQLLQKVGINGGMYTLLDQTLGQVRHLMYHVGCISAILRRETGQPLPWIGYDHPAQSPRR
jgi:uncharacterized damage-inducible protein DinB